MQNTELAVKTGEAAGEGVEKKTSGDYTIAYDIQPAQGLYEFSAGKLEWKEPEQGNAHVSLIVKDAQTGNFVPGLHIVATLLEGRGGRAASNHLPLMWSPSQIHYGANMKVPQSGEYMLQVHVYPATFPRMDKEKGQRYVADTHVQFENVRIDV